MNQNAILEKVRGGLIVSCQALDDEPLYGADIMAKMALAAKQGGAIAIRANGYDDIRVIKKTAGLPVIGIIKQVYAGSDVYITPTISEVEKVALAGADIIAVDATERIRPNGLYPEQFLPLIKRQHPDLLLMADISTVEEGVKAVEFGADIVATTLSGYTPYSRALEGPDFALMVDLVKRVQVPVIAEGRIRTPEEAAQCFEYGVWSVVVGSAITRPQEITRQFVDYLNSSNPEDLRRNG